METVQIRGPVSFRGDNSIFDHREARVSGFYIWCVRVDPSYYRAYYVGEASDIPSRHRAHLRACLSGNYQAHCLDGLRRNQSILMHRPGDGMIPRFSHIDREEFNKEFVDNMCLFSPRSKQLTIKMKIRYSGVVTKRVSSVTLKMQD